MAWTCPLGEQRLGDQELSKVFLREMLEGEYPIASKNSKRFWKKDFQQKNLNKINI